MPVKAMDLFDAYSKNALPKDHGYIVSSFFAANTAYSRYEVVSYNNVKSIYPNEDGLTFQTDGKKLFILIEPSNYPNKGNEPFLRSSAEKIPLRFSELELHTCKNQTRIYWGKDSVVSYGSFTIMRPAGVNFSFCFYLLPDMYQSLQLFFEKTFNKEAGVPLADSKKVSAAVAEKIKTSMAWDFKTE
ncbi:MAG TPA: hypothetical protein PLB91_05800 [Spirochaetales bacterium]|nr:hypothetical protein [Spirochaetales bacterium]HRY53724.1 hypothetical protein [Spirochaetia bacterium]HRZ65502.1 hypothetical protein [Spirochaetia bacterium]